MLIKTRTGVEEVSDFKRNPQEIDIYLDQTQAAAKLGVGKIQFLNMIRAYDLPPDFVADARRGKSPRWSNQRLDWWVDQVLSKQYRPFKVAENFNAEINQIKRLIQGKIE